ncbi:MAG: hypothetical protein A3K68_03685, partial [Euryarchaeota archaeon RBG_16_68_13]
GNPDKKAVILQGNAGVGKTTAALALAADMGWTPVEMNASDSRNAAAIGRVAGRGAVLETFSPTGDFLRTSEGGRKLIILDEADHVFGREDHGGIAAIVQMIQTTQQPIVLIVNDYYGLTGRSSSFKRLCKTIKFQSISAATVKSVIRNVASKESVEVSEDVLDFVAARSEGDLRSALNDLEAIAVGSTTLRGEETKALGARDRASTIFVALQEIFRSGDARRARDSVRELDETPEDLVLWVDHNLPLEYLASEDLARGYASLARADTYLGRTRRRQSYGMWSYASEMLSAGVAVARRGRYAGGQLQFPGYLTQMARSRGRRGARNGLAKKLGAHLHTSASVILNDVLPTFKALFNADAELRVQIVATLGLEDGEVAYLLEEKEDSHAVKHLLESAAKIRGVADAETSRGLQGFDPGPDGDG